MPLTTIALLLALSAAPDGPGECIEGGCSRQLGGATFLLPILQQQAFVSTYVGIREGVAVYRVPDVPIGILGTLDASLAGYQQTLDLGLRLTRWLGLWGQARGTVYTGLTVNSLLVGGGSSVASGEGGLVLRLLHLESSGTQLSLRAGGGYEQGSELTLLPLLSAIVDTPGVTLESILSGNLGEFLLVPTSERSVTGGLFLAQALGGPFLSLQASASARRAWRTSRPFDPSVEDRVDEDATATRFDLAAALAADFKSLGVPLALMGEYLFTGGRQTEVALGRTNPHTHSVALGLYYTGRPNLQLGLGGVVLDAAPHIGRGVRGRFATSGRPRLTYGQLILRYIW
jgi:hypothetical protein